MHDIEETASKSSCSDNEYTNADITNVNEESLEEIEEEESQQNNLTLEERIEILKQKLISIKGEIKLCQELNQREAEELEEIILEFEKSQINSKNDTPVWDTDDCMGTSYNSSLVVQFNEPETFNRSEAMKEHYNTEQHVENNILKSHLEKKLRIRREFAAYSYEQQLLEVEKLCNEELMRVKENVSQLEPLTKIASEWNLTNETYDRYGFFKHNLLVEGFQFGSSEIDIYKTDLQINRLGAIPLTEKNIQRFFNVNNDLTPWLQNSYSLENLKYQSSESHVPVNSV